MFLPIFYLQGRLAVNRGDVGLERDKFCVALLTSEYAPADDHAVLGDVAGFLCDVEPVELPPLKLTVEGREIIWGAGAEPTVFERVTIPDLGWAVVYCKNGDRLMCHGGLGRQNVSGVDVTLAWNQGGIGVERVQA